MSLMGNIAIEAELHKIEIMMEDWKDQNLSPEEQLERLKIYVQQTAEAAKGGWL